MFGRITVVLSGCYHWEMHPKSAIPTLLDLQADTRRISLHQSVSETNPHGGVFGELFLCMKISQIKCKNT